VIWSFLHLIGEGERREQYYSVNYVYNSNDFLFPRTTKLPMMFYKVSERVIHKLRDTHHQRLFFHLDCVLKHSPW